MAVNYVIQANVVNIRNDRPKGDDLFFVDTNIWYWLTYTRASQSDQPPIPYQTTDYPAYIAKVISSQAKLFWCGLSLSELATLIERTERQIFIRSKWSVSLKEYRHNYVSERNNVVAEIQTSWGQIKMMARPVEFLLNEATTEAIFNKISFNAVGVYDLFIIEAIQKAGIFQIMTDDGDFATIPNIRVFTANNKVIHQALSQGKLVVRN